MDKLNRYLEETRGVSAEEAHRLTYSTKCALPFATDDNWWLISDVYVYLTILQEKYGCALWESVYNFCEYKYDGDKVEAWKETCRQCDSYPEYNLNELRHKIECFDTLFPAKDVAEMKKNLERRK